MSEWGSGAGLCCICRFLLFAHVVLSASKLSQQNACTYDRPLHQPTHDQSCKCHSCSSQGMQQNAGLANATHLVALQASTCLQMQDVIGTHPRKAQRMTPVAFPSLTPSRKCCRLPSIGHNLGLHPDCQSWHTLSIASAQTCRQCRCSCQGCSSMQAGCTTCCYVLCVSSLGQQNDITSIMRQKRLRYNCPSYNTVSHPSAPASETTKVS